MLFCGGAGLLNVVLAMVPAGIVKGSETWSNGDSLKHAHW